MSMTSAEARTEIKGLFEKADEIEQKYPDGLTKEASAEDYDEVRSLLTQIDDLETKLATIEEAEQTKGRIQAGRGEYGKPLNGMAHRQVSDILAKHFKDPGLQFIESEAFQKIVESGLLKSNRNRIEFTVPLAEGSKMLLSNAERKAIVTSGSTSAGGFVLEDHVPGYVDIRQREMTVIDLIPKLQTQSNQIEYVREDTFTNSAAVVAEASATTGTSGRKPESVLAYSTQTAPVKTIAHWVPVTNRMLDDAPALRGIINTRLLLGLDLVLEDQVLTGDGSGENFTGILATPGINIQAIGTDSAADAIYKGRTQVRVNGHARPTAVVLHPNDWQAIRLSRENISSGVLGQYLIAPPAVAGPMTLWGMTVVESEAETENTGLVGDFSIGASLFDREQGQIRVGTIDDQFVRNMQTILAELRAAFVVWRPTAFTRVTGI